VNQGGLLFLYQGWLNLKSSPWLGMFYKKQLPSPRPIRALITLRQCHSDLTPFFVSAVLAKHTLNPLGGEHPRERQASA